MRFQDGQEFKEAVRNYCINLGKDCRFRPSEPKRVRAIYTTKGCKWFIFASIETTNKSKDLVVKSMNLNHNNCNNNWKNRLIIAKWVAERYVERFRVNPKMHVKLIRQNIDEEYKVEISKIKLYNARAIALSLIEGDRALQYRQVWDYRAEILRTHPNSTVEIVYENFRENGGQPRFQRLYMCL